MNECTTVSSSFTTVLPRLAPYSSIEMIEPTTRKQIQLCLPSRLHLKEGYKNNTSSRLQCPKTMFPCMIRPRYAVHHKKQGSKLQCNVAPLMKSHRSSYPELTASWCACHERHQVPCISLHPNAQNKYERIETNGRRTQEPSV
jgi:hypothetical protein